MEIRIGNPYATLTVNRKGRLMPALLHEYVTWIWRLNLVLTAFLLVQLFRCEVFRSFPVFTLFLGAEFLHNCVGMALAAAHRPDWYAAYYWYFSQPVSFFLGCWVLWELRARVLARHRALDRLAGTVLLAGFAIAGIASAAALLAERPEKVEERLHALQQKTQETQAIYLCVLALLLIYYRVRPQRTAAGVFAGYTVCTVSAIVCPLLARLTGGGFYQYWAAAQMTSFLCGLAVWHWSVYTARRDAAADAQQELLLREAETPAAKAAAAAAYARMREEMSRVVSGSEHP